ncbi:MAG: cysteine synthase A [Deltaproteobacteria bacterium]|nr:cysteine synthase A [Deltaproteobacteria bacterium]
MADLQTSIADSVLDCVGGTPLVRLRRVLPEGVAEVCGKLEAQNPAGSVKDRPALSMVLDAERRGELREGATIVEATSGNTGISLAMIAAARGYRCILVMPDDMSLERRRILRAYGADVVLTPAEQGMAHAVERARAIRATTPGAWASAQFDNPANPAAHEATTAEEILRQTGGALDAFVAGVGTGGTITGVARVLAARVPGVRIIAVEPSASPVLSGGAPGLHGIQGIGAGFVPENYDASLVHEVMTVNDVAADRMARRLAREEGLLVGQSAGANVHAAVEVAKRLGRGRVVTILCDSGERYLY